jgi:anaerobic magnesium-protoporphyrin IX monomethyl ester cyclase
MNARARVLLVGPQEQENLALGYLGGALETAGHEVHVVGFANRDDGPGVLRAASRQVPDLVGLSMAFQHTIGDFAWLVEALRQAGYRGHLTCGGLVPTFWYQELLADLPGLDTVVRHDGERTLVAMADCLARQQTPCELVGVVWRGPTGIVVGPIRPPEGHLDRLPWPRRDRVPFSVTGVRTAFMLGSRGCYADCAYCAIGAYVRSSGGARYRLRTPEAMAEEMAFLYRDRGVRAYFLQDDLFVLPHESRALERMQRLRSALDANGVGAVALWVKSRPESLTPKVLEQAKELGVVHLFLGIENASDTRLRYLGRSHRAADCRRALELCRQYGIGPSFNLMLFDPESTLDDVGCNLTFAEENLDLPWNVCRTEVYAGTRIFQELRQQGRLQGDYRSHGYRMRDARSEVMFRILRVSLHERALSRDSLLNRLITLAVSWQMLERVFSPDAVGDLGVEVGKVMIAAHQDTLVQLRQTLDFVRDVAPADSRAVRQHARSTGLAAAARDAAWRSQCDALWARMNLRGRQLAETWSCGRRAML